MKIKNVSANNHKKCFEIETAKGKLSLPFSKAGLAPTLKNPISDLFVDKELANQGITYKLASGAENSIPLDAFLDYNADPDYLAKQLLHQLTLDVLDKSKTAKVSRRELARRLSTSPAQLYRLLDPANYSKTLDQMVKLLSVLGYEVEYKIVPGRRKAA